MGIPIAHIVLDIVANIGFGYYLFTEQDRCGCGGDDCSGLKNWAFFVAIVLFVCAGFHTLIIINNMFNQFLSRIPLIGDLLRVIHENWRDIYVISMIVVWGWVLFLVIKYSSVLNCKRDLVLASEIYIAYSVLIAILYGLDRDRIVSFQI